MDTRTTSAKKTLTWRCLATSDTFILVWLITTFFNLDDGVDLAGTIAGAEVVTKISLYYIHERVWEWILRRKDTDTQ